MPTVEQRAAAIKLCLFDVDGVLTDGRLFFNNGGDEFKSFNTLDGQGIKMLQASGVDVGIITGRTSDLVARRANDLGIKWLIQGREDKFAALQEILAQKPVELSEIAFVGDDLPDLRVISRVGLGIAVANAAPFVKEHSHHITERKGGEGAAREVVELIMAAQNTLAAANQHYLESQ